MAACGHCGSERTKRNGASGGAQRFPCRSCGRTFTDRAPRYGAAEELRRFAAGEGPLNPVT